MLVVAKHDSTDNSHWKWCLKMRKKPGVKLHMISKWPVLNEVPPIVFFALEWKGRQCNHLVDVKLHEGRSHFDASQSTPLCDKARLQFSMPTNILLWGIDLLATVLLADILVQVLNENVTRHVLHFTCWKSFHCSLSIKNPHICASCAMFAFDVLSFKWVHAQSWNAKQK